MSQIEQKLASAIKEGQDFYAANTAMVCIGDNFVMQLHESKIAIKDNDGLRLNLCGFNTNITRSRMNVALAALEKPYRMKVKRGEPCLMHIETNKVQKVPVNGWFPVR